MSKFTKYTKRKRYYSLPNVQKNENTVDIYKKLFPYQQISRLLQHFLSFFLFFFRLRFLRSYRHRGFGSYLFDTTISQPRKDNIIMTFVLIPFTSYIIIESDYRAFDIFLSIIFDQYIVLILSKIHKIQKFSFFYCRSLNICLGFGHFFLDKLVFEPIPKIENIYIFMSFLFDLLFDDIGIILCHNIFGYHIFSRHTTD